jgi:peptide/nickel transport system permease protein
VANIREQLGLDLPFYQQYWRYLTNLVQGDLGRSYLQRTEVSTLIAARLPASLLLMAGAILCELVLGLTMGLIAALRRGRATDSTLMVLSFIGSQRHNSWSASCCSMCSPCSSAGSHWRVRHLLAFGPALADLGFARSGWYARMMRSAMLDVLRQDYVRTARAKGLSRWQLSSAMHCPMRCYRSSR